MSRARRCDRCKKFYDLHDEDDTRRIDIMEETPKYKVGDIVGFRDCSSGENRIGQIIAISNDGDIKYDIKTDLKGVVYYGATWKDITYRIVDTDSKELLKRMINDYHYGIYPESEVKKMDIRSGDAIKFKYYGEILEGVVTKIRYSYNSTPYVDIDCRGGSIITCYPADNIIKNSSAERRSMERDMIDAFRYIYLPSIASLANQAKEVAKAMYTPNIKINQTEITGGDRKGLYSTVFFRYYKDPTTVKKSENANNDILLAIAYAYVINRYGTNSKFKKLVDNEIVKMGNDYVIHFGSSDFFIPGEILKRKRWDTYTYVAVQLLFKAYSIRDIQDAIENCTYVKKEK